MCEDCKRRFVWSNLDMVLEKGFDLEDVENYGAQMAVDYLVAAYEAAELAVGGFHKEHESTMEKMILAGVMPDDDDPRH